MIMIKRIGSGTLEFTDPPKIVSYASVVGKKEGEGPLGGSFDKIIYDSYDGLDTYEDAESSLQTEAMSLALQKGGLKKTDIGVVFAGDLLNQCVGSSFGLKEYNIPLLCGFPGGHGDINLPLVMGAPVTIDVRNDGATINFNIDGEKEEVNVADITAPVQIPFAQRMKLAGKWD